MNDSNLRRLDRLETLMIIRPVCPACGNHPSRLVGIDEATNEQTSETMPETGCPSCGWVPFRTIELVGVDVSGLSRVPTRGLKGGVVADA